MATLTTLSPAGQVGSRSNMSPEIYEDSFVPGGLYIMISVPRLYFTGSVPKKYPAEPESNVEFATYDTEASTGCFPEEFHWDLYYHCGKINNIVHRLRRTQYGPSIYQHESFTVDDPRNLREVIGFMRIVTVDSAVIGHAGNYIRNLARTSAAQACRTFPWAIMTANRVRKNLCGNSTDYMLREFTLTRFTEELLRLAYGHVQNTLRSSHPAAKVIAHSLFGVWLDSDLVDKMLASERARDTMLMRRLIFVPAFHQ